MSMGIDVEVGNQIKVAFFVFFFKKSVSFYAFAFDLSFFWYYIATLFLSVLADSTTYIVLFATFAFVGN